MHNYGFKPTRDDMHSAGSMSDPMYRQIHSDGTYHPETGRKLRRRRERQDRKELKRITKLMEEK